MISHKKPQSGNFSISWQILVSSLKEGLARVSWKAALTEFAIIEQRYEEASSCAGLDVYGCLCMILFLWDVIQVNGCSHAAGLLARSDLWPKRDFHIFKWLKKVKRRIIFCIISHSHFGVHKQVFVATLIHLCVACGCFQATTAARSLCGGDHMACPQCTIGPFTGKLCWPLL